MEGFHVVEAVWDMEVPQCDPVHGKTPVEDLKKLKQNMKLVYNF